MSATNAAGDRRLRPRIWRDHDWHVMRNLRAAIGLVGCEQVELGEVQFARMSAPPGFTA